MPKVSKNRLRILIFGILIPCAFTYVCYRLALRRYEFDVFGRPGMTQHFAQDVIAKRIEGFEKADLLVLGDSTARAALVPAETRPLETANLAQNWGSAFASYFVFKEYLEAHPAPKCVLMLHQYNYGHAQTSFFDGPAFYWKFGFGELLDIWKTGSDAGDWPATEVSAPEFVSKALRAELRLDRFRLGALQGAIYGKHVEAGKVIAAMQRDRGHAPCPTTASLSDPTFFPAANYRVFLSKFAASRIEDSYLERIAKLAAENGTTLIYGAPPVAESPAASRTREFRSGRDAHLAELLSPSARILSLDAEGPLESFCNFAHLNANGAVAFTKRILPSLLENCTRRE